MSRTIYLHPLAYLIGLEGVALMRSFAGDDHDAEFVADRLAEIRKLLDTADELGPPAVVPELSAADGYDQWSVEYDHPGNGLIDHEQPIVRAMIDELPPGDALDAACGTGRHAAYLLERGHRVIGVDASPKMLDRAKINAPGADLRAGMLDRLPVPDDHVHLVVCALALTHVPELGPAFAEFARVLRPGGRLIVTDAHGFMIGASRYPLVRIAPDGRAGYIPGWSHPTSDYLRAALDQGFAVLSCEETRFGAQFVDPEGPIEALVPGRPPDPFQLHGHAPIATNAAYRDQPIAIFWQFRLPH